MKYEAVGRRASGWLDGVGRYLRLISGILIVFLMLATSTDVIWRATVGRPIPGVQDYSVIALVIVVYASIGCAQRTGEHIEFGLVARLIPRKIASACTLIGLLMVSVVFVWMIGASIPQGLESWRMGEYLLGLARVPLWPARLAVVLGLMMLLLELLRTTWSHVQILLSGEPRTANVPG
jgi:TRAP-type C4-dicarboxylate transport system permease small subunit